MVGGGSPGHCAHCHKRLAGTNTATRISALLPGLTLDQIATCPDEVRNLEEHHVALDANCKKIFPILMTGTGSWHFVDTPVTGIPIRTRPRSDGATLSSRERSPAMPFDYKLDGSLASRTS
jgi:hypothetical protein